jgi:hypothetical protein
LSIRVPFPAGYAVQTHEHLQGCDAAVRHNDRQTIFAAGLASDHGEAVGRRAYVDRDVLHRRLTQGVECVIVVMGAPEGVGGSFATIGVV